MGFAFPSSLEGKNKHYGGYSLHGVGPEAETVTDPETGARQSRLDYRFDLLPPLATARVAAILGAGASKYGEWNWTGIPASENINHALAHIFAYVAGDSQEGGPENHLHHALCRLMFAVDVCERSRQQELWEG